MSRIRFPAELQAFHFFDELGSGYSFRMQRDDVLAVWSSGMILPSGGRGRGFESPNGPLFQERLLFFCRISLSRRYLVI